MLIRHHVRSGNRTGGKHWAHDTAQPDIKGCFVSGSTERVFTSETNKCPQCQGYGQLVQISPLARSTYPTGSTIPDKCRVGGQPTPETPQDTPQPEYVPEYTPHPAPVPTPAPVGDGDAAAAMAAMLAAIVPEANRIKATVQDAVAEATANAEAGSKAALEESIATLSANFDETVKRLIVPVRIIVDRNNGTPPKEIEGTVHSAFAKCLDWLRAGCNLYLVGPAGSGKTTLAKQLAEALNVPFFTTGQVLSEHQVTGFVDAGGSYHPTPFYEAYRPDGHGGVWLGDEFDAWSPEAALACNAALANGHATFPNNPHPIGRHGENYMMVAANTWGTGADREYVGRNEMDAASLSRFISIPVDYDRALETQLSAGHSEWANLVWKVRDNASRLKVRRMFGTRELVAGVKGLTAGMPLETVTADVLRRDMDSATWDKLTGRG